MKFIEHNLKRTVMIFAVGAIGILFTLDTYAQEKFILAVTEFTVKNGHEKHFEDGIKAWKECYLENNGEWTWTIWQRSNGKGSVYALTSSMKNWAEMDEATDEAGQKCREIAMEKIVPHVESRENNFYSSMPEISKSRNLQEMGVLWVTFFKVENSTVFNSIIKEISEIMQEREGDQRGLWYSAAGGGPEAPSYFVSTPFENYAALDIERDGVWTTVEKAKGKEERDKMQAEFRAAVKDIWSYIYQQKKELSHFGGE